MDKNLERIERYLQGIEAPEHASESHRQQLRRQILRKIEQRRTRPAWHTGWSVAAAVTGLVCIGGAIAGVVGSKHLGADRPVDGSPAYVRTVSVPDVDGAAAVQPSTNESLQIDALPQKDSVELVQVIESEVNGRVIDRTLIQKCVLSSGRMEAGRRGKQTPVTLPAAAWQEIGQLRHAGKMENLGTQERQMKGRLFLFKRERYILHDGTTVTLSVGEPKDVSQPLPAVPGGSYP
jgi:hypothetical protein